MLTDRQPARPPRYELHDGSAYLVLHRDRELGPTDRCPFCGKQHWHGEGDGHRVAHCVKGRGRTLIAADGTKLDQAAGYVIRTRKAA